MNPSVNVQQDTLKVEERYRKKLETYATENLELKEELSKITDRCIEFGMLKKLIEEKSPRREFSKILLTPKTTKESFKRTPQNQL